MPREIFPADAGLIVADAYGAELLREAPEHRLHAATRRSMMLCFARAAARRLQALADPQGPYGEEVCGQSPVIARRAQRRDEAISPTRIRRS